MLKTIQLKIYYRFLEFISLIPIKDGYKDKSIKKCFIYFDYEREFSGHKTDITNSDVEHLIEHLEKNKIQTTWFTVGKVIENYFDTISKLVLKGHEIGSHTYNHISPKVMRPNTMNSDFENFDKIKTKHKLNIQGFHSPNGQWNIAMFNYLLKNEYVYDVISLPIKNTDIVPMTFKLVKKYPVVRLVTVGDDWPLYKAGKSRIEVFEYFKSLYLKTKKGDTFGIGFHPWILYSDENILLGYKDFISFITQQDDTIIKPAISLVRDLKMTFDLANKEKVKIL